MARCQVVGHHAGEGTRGKRYDRLGAEQGVCPQGRAVDRVVERGTPGLEQDVETRLLTLLGTGFKDEAIARYLGIGVRTVRRRVAALMEEHGVHTRFQLGAVAERRGLLRRRP